MLNAQAGNSRDVFVCSGPSGGLLLI